jgi:hypothetical protein
VTPALRPDGRSFRWRLGALAVGAVFGGGAFALWVRPERLASAVAAGLALVALVCIASALFAKGRR